MVKVFDSEGNIIEVGMPVRVVQYNVAAYGFTELSTIDAVVSMIGEVFPVESIDTEGKAWISKVFYDARGGEYCHCISLSCDEMMLALEGLSDSGLSEMVA